MRHAIFTLLIALPVCGHCQEQPWVPMNGAEISAALSDRKLTYAGASQFFYASGRTLYDSGRPSWGYWRVEKDAYCSMWPPSDLWTCYKMDRRGETLRFVGDRDDITEGSYANERRGGCRKAAPYAVRGR